MNCDRKVVCCSVVNIFFVLFLNEYEKRNVAMKGQSKQPHKKQSANSMMIKLKVSACT